MGNYEKNTFKEKSEENFKVGLYSEQQKYYHSAISRYYYSIYQRILAFIFSKNIQIELNGTNSHISTIDGFQKEMQKLCINGDFKFEDLQYLTHIRKLKDIRNKYEYKNHEISSPDVFNREFKYIFDIVKEMFDQYDFLK